MNEGYCSSLRRHIEIERSEDASFAPFERLTLPEYSTDDEPVLPMFKSQLSLICFASLSYEYKSDLQVISGLLLKAIETVLNWSLQLTPNEVISIVNEKVEEGFAEISL